MKKCRDIILYDNSSNSWLRPIRMTAGGTAIEDLPFRRDPGSKRFNSTYCS